MTEPVTVIALCGLSPQVVTETIWALLKAGKKIGALHVITTDIGKQLFDQKITRGNNILENLWSLFGHDLAQVAEVNFHIIKNSRAETIPDILSVDDHLSATELIGEKIWSVTRPGMQPLHASAAGGRKTMSIMLSTAMSLYARPQDRLSHVLASPDIERDPIFLYPHKRHLKKPSYIQLVDVPFPRLAPLLPDIGLPLSMEKLIGQLDQHLSHMAKVILDVKQKRLIVGDKSVHLPPLLVAIYLLFTRHRQGDEMSLIHI